MRPVAKRTPDRRQPVRWNPASTLCAQAYQPIAYTLAWRANVERGAAWFLDIHRGEKTGHAKANKEIAPPTGETTVRTDANRTTPLRARRATDGPLSRIPIVLPVTGPWEGSGGNKETPGQPSGRAGAVPGSPVRPAPLLVPGNGSGSACISSTGTVWSPASPLCAELSQRNPRGIFGNGRPVERRAAGLERRVP